MNPHANARPDSHEALVNRLEEAERRLDELRDQLEHAHRLTMLGTLAAGVVHEINNILTPVLAYAQMAGSNPNDAELLAKVAQKTARGIRQATDIADSMLELAQPGRAEWEPAKATILDTCHSAINCLGRDPAKDGITWSIDVPEDLTGAIRPLALQQVILNLLINAITALKSVPTRERTLTIRAWRVSGGGVADHAGETVRIEVADSGPGIPDAIRAKLFTPFVSGRRTPGGQPATRSEHEPAHQASPATSGSGLGLSVCRTLIESAGGTISATSHSSTGTVFTIDLPHDHVQSRRMAG